MSPAPTAPAVLYTVADGVAEVRLNRPHRLNAISRDLVAALNAALAAAADDPQVRVIILAAEGRAFCAGDDLIEFIELNPTEAEVRLAVDALQEVTRRLMLGDKPVICAAQGWIVGGGAAWPLNADFLVVADDATLFCPEASYGLFPTGGMSILLRDACGPGVASSVLWLGDRLRAPDLHRLGLAAAPLPGDELAAHARTLALRLAALPAHTRGAYKRAYTNDVRARLEAALVYEADRCVEAVFNPEVRRRVDESKVNA